MANTSSQDPQSHWPKEVKQAYETLKVPTIYETVLANEKLSLEIRRQNRELKTLEGHLQKIHEQLASIIHLVSEEWVEVEDEDEEEGTGAEKTSPFHELEIDQDGFGTLEEGLAELEAELIEKEQVTQTLIETYDIMKDLARMAKQMARQLDTILPARQSSSPMIEEIMKTLSEIIEQSRYRLLGRLKEVDIEIIDPRPGETFNESIHHAIEHERGGKSGTVARVVRAGYQQRGELLRLADVTLYT